MIYLKLFLSFLQIGAFSFGGGYAAIPLIQNQVVNTNNWLSLEEFTNLITISQMTPGPIAINSATFVGIQIAGFWGAAAATIGCILPSCIIVSALAYIYIKYRRLSMLQGILNSLRPAVVALIATAGLSIIISSFFGGKGISLNISDIRIQAVVIFGIAILLLRKFKMNPIYVMIITGILEVIYQTAAKYII